MADAHTEESARLRLEIQPQPDMTTCGPTCLHAVYRYFRDEISLERVIAEIPQLAEGGTLAAVLGCHALGRGYQATIYTFDLQVFDPTWFSERPLRLPEKLRLQREAKASRKLRTATHYYLDFLRQGGEIRLRDLTSELIRRHLNRSLPILTGLSATYLYQESREVGRQGTPDDVHGLPSGHFVVLCGYDRTRREVLIADPLSPNPLADVDQYYHIAIDRVKCAILLGIMTYDANLLILHPRDARKGSRRVRTDRDR
jgi:hypothetical protein